MCIVKSASRSPNWTDIMINERQRQLAILKVIGFLTALLFVLVCAGYAHCQENNQSDSALYFEWNDTKEDYTFKVESHVRTWFKHAVKSELRRAYVLVPFVIDESEKESVNPSLIAAIVSYESNWDVKAISRMGAIGLMQVLNLKVKWIDARDPKDQLHQGILLLKESYKKCGDILGTIAHYGTGKTCAVYSKARLRYNKFIEIESY